MLVLQHSKRNKRLAIGALICAAAWGQAGPQPTFEAASVKLATGGRGGARMKGGPGTADEGRITYTNVTVIDLLARAYDVQTYQVSGAGWMSSERYDISATIPPGTDAGQFRRMLQGLVAQRFHLVLHHETRELEGFELVMGAKGSKLKPSVGGAPGNAAETPDAPPKIDAKGFPILTAPGLAMMEGVRGKSVVSYLAAKAQPVSALADWLSREFRLPVVEKTGLSGTFDFTLEFAPQAPGAMSSAAIEAASAEDAAPNLVTAVQEQLGLKLISRKIPVDMLAIDRADRIPVGN